jgi:hypothetical protein
MPVITIGTTGAIWGLDAETGIIVQSVTQKVVREKNQVRNEAGEFSLVAFYNPLKTVTVQGVYRAASGIAAAAPGVALTIANMVAANGVTTGGIYTDDVELSMVNTDFRKYSVNATQYPLIS